jgi:hypothetical protein
MAVTVSILQKNVFFFYKKMSYLHFDLSLKLSQGEVHDFSGEVKKFSGEVQNDLRGGAHLPSKSGHVRNHTVTSVNRKDLFIILYQ